MKAVGEFIIAKVEEPSEKLEGTELFRPSDAPDDFKKGQVVSVGGDVKEIAVNDTILVNKRSGVVVKIDGEEYTVIPQKEVLVVL